MEPHIRLIVNRTVRKACTLLQFEDPFLRQTITLNYIPECIIKVSVKEVNNVHISSQAVKKTCIYFKISNIMIVFMR